MHFPSVGQFVGLNLAGNLDFFCNVNVPTWLGGASPFNRELRQRVFFFHVC